MANQLENEEHMRQATKKALDGIEMGGGPFGALITSPSGDVISCCHNQVVSTCDPTAHAEIVAIRQACQLLNTHDLHGYTLYTTCEPCSMCLSAIYWARIDTVFYGNTRDDAKSVEFDDTFIYDEVAKDPKDRSIHITQLSRDITIETFQKWQQKNDKVPY
jgi:tRNA(Arg) A34 adenosine deaminase TadA